jgi:23S rRNA (uracil1939-C5)-methyltransferase
MTRGAPATVTVALEGLAAGGDAVGHLDGGPLFVPGGAPGDLVEVRPGTASRGPRRAVIVRILEPGPGRRDPGCPLFGRCGGCQWLHLDEAVQRSAKEQTLGRALGIDRVPVRPSPLALGYRGRARLQARSAKGGGVRLGFLRRRSAEVVDLASCPILAPGIDRALGPLRRGPLSRLGGHAEVRLADGLDGCIAAIALAGGAGADLYREARELVPRQLSGIAVEADGAAPGVIGAGEARVVGGDGEDLLIPATSFGQANPEVNLALGAAVAEWVEGLAARSAIELFAGAGNLSVVLGPRVGRLTTVETDRAACDAARKNLERRGLGRVHVVAGDAEERFAADGARVDLVVLDPPRVGAGPLMERIAGAGPRHVIHVSCNPAALRREAALMTAAGYRVAGVRGFDMFPQTPHVEAAVLFARE